MSRMTTKQMLKNVARKTGREAAANDDHGSADELVAYGRETARIEKNIAALSDKLAMFSKATKEIVKTLRQQQQLYLKSISDGTRNEHAISQVRDILDRQNGKERPKGLKVEEEIAGNFVVRFENEFDVGF